MAFCCPNCFDDFVIQDFIRSGAEKNGKCQFCGSRRVPLRNTEVVGQLIKEGVNREYANAASEGMPYELWEFESIKEVLDNEGVFSSLIDDPTDLVAALREGM